MPARHPALAADAVHVWLAEMPEWARRIDELRRVLSPEEVERASRFRQLADQQRSMLARGLTRVLLARYLETDAPILRFELGPNGKPQLAGDRSLLQFNVSHSGDVVLLAFASSAPVGVDVERLRPEMLRQEEIAERHFSPGEVRELMALPQADRAGAFFRCWSRKEAYIKMRGDGIFAGLHSFAVSLDPGDARLLSAVTGPGAEECSMSALPNIPGYEAAVCVALPQAPVRCWQADPELLRLR